MSIVVELILNFCRVEEGICYQSTAFGKFLDCAISAPTFWEMEVFVYFEVGLGLSHHQALRLSHDVAVELGLRIKPYEPVPVPVPVLAWAE
jgi:hypothetical protein